MRGSANSWNLATQIASLAPLLGMKRLILIIVLLATVAPAAAEVRVALDYRADDTSCSDAGRFADEVSAKLGFVPWDDRVSATLRVRIAREGTLFIGSFRNADGSSKVVDGRTCGEVTALLAVTVATAIDPGSSPTRSPSEAAPAIDDTVPVTFGGDRRFDVSIRVATAISIGIESDSPTPTASRYYESLCTSPCTARLPRGRSYLAVYDPDSQAEAGGPFVFDDSTSITIQHHSRAGTRKATFAVGVLLTAASIVTSVMVGRAHGWQWGAMTSISTGIGVGVMGGSLWIEDQLSMTRSP